MKNKQVEMLSVEQRYSLLFASRLRSVLEAANISQAKLAQKIGLSPQMVSHYCLGNNVPQISVLIEIAKVLNVSTDYLLGLTENESTNSEIRSISEYTGLNTESIETLHKYQSIPLFIDVVNFLFQDLQLLESIADYLTTPFLDIIKKPPYNHVNLTLPIFHKMSALRAADLYASAVSAQDTFVKSNDENDDLKKYVADRYIAMYSTGSSACTVSRPGGACTHHEFLHILCYDESRTEREEFIQSLKYFGIADINHVNAVKTAEKQRSFDTVADEK